MDVFHNSNWKLTKFLLSSFGAWPFQSLFIRTVFRSLVIVSIASIFIPEVLFLELKFIFHHFKYHNRNEFVSVEHHQIADFSYSSEISLKSNYFQNLRLFTVWGDINALVECAPIYALHSLTITKLSNCLWNNNKIKVLLSHIRRDWQSDLSASETEILNSDASYNRRITHAYIYFIYAVTVLYLSTPLVPKVLDYVSPLNTSRLTMFPYQVEYFVDSKTYEVPIFIHAYMITPFPSTIIVAFDSLYANCVQHACSMFTIVGLRLKNISYHGEYMVDVKSRDEAEEKMYRVLKNCIKKHQEVLRFSRLLEVCYSQCLMVIVGINMAALSITGLQMVIKMDELSEALRFGTYTIGQVVHLYFLSFPGQKLLDHSAQISQSVYQGQWYKIPPKSRRLFILVIMRSREPCKLTAGKMYTMSSRSFARVVKKSMSYFTVFNSMQ